MILYTVVQSGSSSAGFLRLTLVAKKGLVENWYSIEPCCLQVQLSRYDNRTYPYVQTIKNSECIKSNYVVGFNVLLTLHLGTIFVNNQLDAQLFFMYVYFYSLHVSGQPCAHLPPPLVALQPNAGHDLFILEVSRSHTTTHHSR